jgi:hypothetical protein
MYPAESPVDSTGSATIDYGGKPMECKVCSYYGTYYFIGDYGVTYGRGSSPTVPDEYLRSSLVDGTEHGLADDVFSQDLEAGDYVDNVGITVKYNGDETVTMDGERVYGGSERVYGGRVLLMWFLSVGFHASPGEFESSKVGNVIWNGKSVQCRLVHDYYTYYVGDYGIVYKMSDDEGHSETMKTSLDI